MFVENTKNHSVSQVLNMKHQSVLSLLLYVFLAFWFKQQQTTMDKL